MTSVVNSVLEVFSAIGDWFVDIIPTLTTIFYSAEGGLTFLGVLAVCGLAVGIILLVMGIIQGFLGFRG